MNKMGKALTGKRLERKLSRRAIITLLWSLVYSSIYLPASSFASGCRGKVSVRRQTQEKRLRNRRSETTTRLQSTRVGRDQVEITSTEHFWLELRKSAIDWSSACLCVSPAVRAADMEPGRHVWIGDPAIRFHVSLAVTGRKCFCYVYVSDLYISWSSTQCDSVRLSAMSKIDTQWDNTISWDWRLRDGLVPERWMAGKYSGLERRKTTSEAQE